jgi:hypothetical protein
MIPTPILFALPSMPSEIMTRTDDVDDDDDDDVENGKFGIWDNADEFPFKAKARPPRDARSQDRRLWG